MVHAKRYKQTLTFAVVNSITPERTVELVRHFYILYKLSFLMVRRVTEIDDCISILCQNGGKCTDGVLSYQCDCPDGFTGTICETGRKHEQQMQLQW